MESEGEGELGLRPSVPRGRHGPRRATQNLEISWKRRQVPCRQATVQLWPVQNEESMRKYGVRVEGVW